MAKMKPIEIQVTLESGKVLDFKVSLGDKLSMQQVNTYTGDQPTEKNKVTYYVLQVAPCEGTEG